MILDDIYYAGYDIKYFNKDMELTNEFNDRVEKGEYISEEEQTVYNYATDRVMQYNVLLGKSNTNVWERYAEKNQQYNDFKGGYSQQPTDEIDSVDAVTGRIPEMNNGQNVTSGKGVSAPSGEESNYRQAQELQKEYPEWSLEQITNKMSEIVWNNNYKALMDDIAHSSSPEEREQKIRDHQWELDNYKASGIDVDNDEKYLRDTQGMPEIHTALIQEFVENLQYSLSPNSAATTHSELNEQDDGYHLDPDEFKVNRRYNALGIIHSHDLPNYLELKNAWQSAWQNTESFSLGFTQEIGDNLAFDLPSKLGMHFDPGDKKTSLYAGKTAADIVTTIGAVGGLVKSGGEVIGGTALMATGVGIVPGVAIDADGIASAAYSIKVAQTSMGNFLGNNNNLIKAITSDQGSSKAVPNKPTNPLDDPRIAKEIQYDPNAVYEYSPKPGTPLDKFKVDWSNPEQVAAARSERINYLEKLKVKNQLLDDEVSALQKEGMSMEDIARNKVEQRNQDRINSYIKSGNMEGVEAMKTRNLSQYGRQEGPTADQLFAQKGSWEEVVYGSVRSSPAMDVLTGLYK